MSRNSQRYTRWRNDPPEEDEEETAEGVDAPLEGQEEFDQMQEGRRVLAMMTPRNPEEGQGLLTRAATVRLLLMIALVTATCLVLGALLGYVIGAKLHSSPVTDECPSGDPPAPTTTTTTTESSKATSRAPLVIDDGFPEEEGIEALAAHFLSHLTPTLIKKYVEKLTKTDPTTLKDFIRETWVEQGFQTKIRSFPVVTSTPDVRVPNTVEVLMKDGSSVFLNNRTKSLEGFSPFSGFSPNGSVSGALVYGRYATKADFKTLKEKGIDVNGSLLLVRLKDDLHPGVQVRNAEEKGVIGVILYPDPEDFRGSDPNSSYPLGMGLPLDGVVWQNLRFQAGDPSTPNFVSQKHTYRIPEEMYTGVPSIVVQPVSGDTGRELLSHMGGQSVPQEWVGKLGVNYTFGGVFRGDVDQVRVTTHNVLAVTHGNVVRAFRPAKDAAKAIHIGCHYDTKDGHLTSSGVGLASLLALGEAMKEVFPFGTNRLVTLTAFEGRNGDFSAGNEYSQIFSWSLESSAMAYIDMDSILEGSGFVEAHVSPLLQETVHEVLEHIAWVGKEALSVYQGLADVIPYLHPTKSQQEQGARDSFGYSNPYECDESFNFLNVHGIPAIKLTAVNLNKSKTFSLRHSQYDRMENVINLVDKELLWTHMIVSAMSVAALSLSSSLLPKVRFNVVSHDLSSSWSEFLNQEKKNLNRSEPSVHELTGEISFALSVLELVCSSYDTWYSKGFDIKKDVTPYEKFRLVDVRLVQLQQFGRRFLRPRNAPNYPDMGSLLTYGPSPDDPCEGAAFPFIRRALKEALEGRGSWESVHQEMAILLSSLNIVNAP